MFCCREKLIGLQVIQQNKKSTQTIVKKDEYIKFYDVARPLCPVTVSSGSCLATRLLQVGVSMNCGYDEVPGNTKLHPIAIGQQSLLSTEWCYCNIECKAFGILHGLEKLYYYCFVRGLCIITDHKLL